MSARGTRAIRLAALVAAAAGLGLWIAWPSIAAAALLLDLTGAAPRVRPWLPVARHAVARDDLTAPTRFGAIAARRYRPAGIDGPPLLVFPGVHGGGVDEPRLVTLAGHLASAGAQVITVPLPDLRAYQVTTRATDMIEDTIAWAAGEFGGPRQQIGVVGVSFAGGLALVAAGRPGISERLTAIFTLGAHADLPRVMDYLCADGAPATLPPPHDYGVVLMLRASLSVILPPDQIPALDRALVTFLDASSAESSDRAWSARLFEEARAQAQTLPEPSRSLMRAVNARDVRTLGRALAPFTEQVGGAPALSPARSPATRAPVFLLHGDRDSVIPASEAPALAAHLRAEGNARVDALLTPLLTHADARPTVGLAETWRLIRFWTRLWKGLAG